jgi:PPK2 family polyphosphate:nucleotide phosphotransferase
MSVAVRQCPAEIAMVLCMGHKPPVIATEDFRLTPGAPVDFDRLLTLAPFASLGDRALKKALKSRVRRFSRLQELLYAEGRQALLLVFQGMDAAGKDSAIKRVTSGVNPQGFRVTNFSRPTEREVEHTWLHRHWQALPERGRIGIFNRSHYEEVVTLRVHPELLAARRLPPVAVDEAFWERRLADIVAFERHLADNGTTVVKFFLNVSGAEQQRRLTERLRNPQKHWKFDSSDLEARRQWHAYQRAYAHALEATTTAEAPWYAIPADNKPAARVLIASVIVEVLTAMDPRFPDSDDALLRDIRTLRDSLGS